MTHEELEKSLENGLRSDTSGKSTPLQRLTPFLRDLVAFVKPQEFVAHATISGHMNEKGEFVADEISIPEDSRVATASPNSGIDGNSKATD